MTNIFFFFFNEPTVQSRPFFASLMDLSQSALFFYLSFLFVIWHLRVLIPVCTQFHHLFFGHPLSWLTCGLVLNTWFRFLLLSILLTCAIQFNQLILTNESISKSPNSCIKSLLYHFLQFSFTFICPNIFIKTFLSKAARRLAIFLFTVQDSVL